MLNIVFLQCMQTEASASGIQTAACSVDALLPPSMMNEQTIVRTGLKRHVLCKQHHNTEKINILLFFNKSWMHLFKWAIHSDFSVAVAAYAANDFWDVLMSQPLRRSGMKNILIFPFWSFPSLALPTTRGLKNPRGWHLAWENLTFKKSLNAYLLGEQASLFTLFLAIYWECAKLQCWGDVDPGGIRVKNLEYALVLTCRLFRLKNEREL